MRKRAINKIIGTLLSLAVVLALLPVLPQMALAATGSLYVGGSNALDLSADHGDLTTVGWSWTANTNTLTLNSNYSDISGNHIIISCQASDTINLVYTENVTIDAAGGYNAINCDGNLNISGSGTLTLSTSAQNFVVLSAEGDLKINSGTISAATAENFSGAISSTNGDITISGNANVTASGTGLYAIGIMATNGDVTISTSGKVEAVGDEAGIVCLGSIDISSGTVTAKGDSRGISAGVVKITGGTVVSGGNDKSTGDIQGHLTVSGADTSVTVNGNIIFSGNLTVSDGAVTVTGTVGGTTTVTGGTVTVNGNAVMPTPHSLTVAAGAGGSVSGTVSGNYAAGQAVSITATPNTDYAFDSWTASGITVGNTATISFNMPDNTVTLTANFRYSGGSTTPVDDDSPATEDEGEDTSVNITLDGVSIGAAVVGDSLSLEPNQAQWTQLIAQAGDGPVELDMSAFMSAQGSGIAEVGLQVPADWFRSLGRDMTLNAGPIGTLTISDAMLGIIADRYTGSIEFVVSKGSLVFDIKNNGKSIRWSNPDVPIRIGAPLKTDVALPAVTLYNAETLAVAENIAYEDGVVYGDVFTTGRFIAEVTSSNVNALPAYRVIARRLNVRSVPAIASGNIVGTLSMNTIVTASEVANGWAKVTLENGVTGYCSLRYLVPFAGAAATGTLTTTAPLNMRVGPGTNFVSLGTIPKGRSVTVTGYDKEWAIATVNGRTVYLHSAYLR